MMKLSSDQLVDLVGDGIHWVAANKEEYLESNSFKKVDQCLEGLKKTHSAKSGPGSLVVDAVELHCHPLT